MGDEMEFTDKEIKIDIGTGEAVYVSFTFAEEKSLESLLIAYLEQDASYKKAA